MVRVVRVARVVKAGMAVASTEMVVAMVAVAAGRPAT